MKILFVYPKFTKFLKEHTVSLENFLDGRPKETESVALFHAPPALGIPILTSLTPKEHTCEFINDNVQEIDFNTDADLIAVSFFTPQATRAYEICDRFREKNKIVVAGGMHPGICPQETMQHADIVCAGEGENAWLQILKDIERGDYKKLYTPNASTDLNALPIPDRSIFYKDRNLYTWQCDVVQVMRGCNANCSVCVLPHIFGKDIRFKEISKVMDDIDALEFEIFYLADDQLFILDDAIEAYAFELFEKMKDHCADKQVFINTIPARNHNPKLLKAMAKAGVTSFYSTIGFDPISINALIKGRKNLRQKMIDQVKAVQDTGMLFFASFVLGMDEQYLSYKETVLEFCRDAGINLAEFFIMTPLPRTPVWKRLEKQDRILHKNWEKYNGANVVFRPKNMTSDELMSLFLDIWEDFPKYGSLISSIRKKEETIDDLLCRTHAKEKKNGV